MFLLSYGGVSEAAFLSIIFIYIFSYRSSSTWKFIWGKQRSRVYGCCHQT